MTLDTRRTACLATIPGRSGELLACVGSLLPQMDSIHVILNYGEVPAPPEVMQLLVNHPNLALHHSDNAMGDAMKFSVSDQTDGYQFICDDDIIYPPDFAEKMIAKIEQHGRRALVGVGGSVIEGHLDSYYSGRKVKAHTFRLVAQDTPVNNLLTCGLAFHSQTTRFHMSEFKHANMADIFCALHCQRERLPMLVIAHEPGWLKYPRSMKSKPTIWDTRAEHDPIQAGYANEWTDWKVYQDKEA